ncbi:Cytochrome c biogenesis ATP-binding export protein CcmA [Zhongshania aliphaticivorans]|uniref:Cytochrome c biogenesis ATP-binding export protein CcmA n=1 Tax=Zhongshania aliphaticivorans TaxID=1470434 RepID=A0A5S9QMJ1_9GAMM|nr:cytochrome c biogenesis heme-transporting ATPase CcmA [Zhongshania aliphaticivorans]CAA0087780.1 Cytochrome c biogenesis ATP-binding export protein CcmA [Zhongshania aliphaticivorans]CAA0115449.1 Cytochrome c biogenesis ATP-binding export protein CcmA [Zhongshania aliphaticivorans]CAA0120230.1 Cytochrome c biogenesis ATP-binding export protein CcmA [Zhongshania aliphaticivorans]
MATTGLEIKQLFSDRDDRVLFSELSFQLNAGELIQVAGPNGSGKTTLLRILAGLSSYYQGEVLWQGKSLRRQRHDYLQQLLYIGHGAGIKAVLSPLENLRWSCAVRGIRKNDANIFSALEKVGLLGFEEQPCFSLSAGQQRRVNLARLFCIPSKLWILDEPFTAIDLAGVAEIEQWLSDFVSEGGAVLLTTHHRLSFSQDFSVVDLGAMHYG